MNLSVELIEDGAEPTVEGLRLPAGVRLEPTRWFEWAWTAQYAAEGRTSVSDAVPPEASWSRPLFAPVAASKE